MWRSKKRSWEVGMCHTWKTIWTLGPFGEFLKGTFWVIKWNTFFGRDQTWCKCMVTFEGFSGETSVFFGLVIWWPLFFFESFDGQNGELVFLIWDPWRIWLVRDLLWLVWLMLFRIAQPGTQSMCISQRFPTSIPPGKEWKRHWKYGASQLQVPCFGLWCHLSVN